MFVAFRVFSEPKTLNDLQEFKIFFQKVLKEVPEKEKLFNPIKEKMAIYSEYIINFIFLK